VLVEHGRKMIRWGGVRAEIPSPAHAVEHQSYRTMKKWKGNDMHVKKATLNSAALFNLEFGHLVPSCVLWTCRIQIVCSNLSSRLISHITVFFSYNKQHQSTYQWQKPKSNNSILFLAGVHRCYLLPAWSGSEMYYKNPRPTSLVSYDTTRMNMMIV
jgi:hypothetical protein